MRRSTTGNRGLASGGSNVPVRQFFVNLGFVARTEFSAENPARTPSPEPLVAMLTDDRAKLKVRTKID